MSDGKNSKDVKAQNCEFGSVGQLNDPVNHPAHYTTGKIEVIDYIEDQKLPYHLGNAVKYISRAGKKDKDKTVEDLKKAVWYIQRYIGLIMIRRTERMIQTTPMPQMNSVSAPPCQKTS